ncbi:SDR family oxidoreductase [Sorangium sp. So ce764]|uniref:SDR family oxidoreductase n=1 Tax=unclassified Sorangium TaxID=2621164 RepID=UPI003F613F97
MWIARSRGVPVTVFRPGSILGHSQTGAANVTDFVSRMIKGCLAEAARRYPRSSSRRTFTAQALYDGCREYWSKAGNVSLFVIS